MNDSVQLFNKQLSVVTKPIPKVSVPDDVLVKVHYSGVCGTDLHILSGEFPATDKAVTLGHEFCGTVQSVGADVGHVKPGDRVVVNPNCNCHVCSYCANGEPHFCNTGGIRSTVGIWKNGGWARYCKVSAVLVHKVPHEVALSRAVFTEPYSCIARGLQLLGSIRANAKILVCGAGIIGLLWSALLHFKGFREFTITEVSEKRRQIASTMGLGLKILHPEQLVNSHREAKRNKDEDFGFDIVIDCTGVPAALEQAFNWLRRGAKFLLFGCCPKDSEIKVNPLEINMKEIQIIGSHINPFTFPTAMALVRDMGAYLDYEKLGVKTYQLHDYPEALSALKEGRISKAVFHVDHESSN